MNLTTSFQKLGEVVIGNAGYGNFLLRLYGRYKSQSIESNSTEVEYQLRHYVPSGAGYITYWSSSQKLTGDLTNSSSNSQNKTFNVGEETLLTATKTITHNDDGTKSISVGGSFTNSYFGNTVSISNVTVTLPTIARASSVSSSSPYIGDNATIIISSASSSFRHTLSYSFGSASGTIADKTSATTVAWDTNAIKSSLYAQIPNAKSGSGTITCQTYSGNTIIGTKTCSFNLYAKESDCKPDISGTVVDTNSSTIALTGDSSKLIRYMSKPKVTISASAKYSSSIKSYSINADGKTTNSNSVTLSTITSNNITISVTDSRGYSNSKTLTPTIINYVKLTSNLTIERPEQTSNEAYLNGSGQWFNGNFSSSNANTLTITAKYRKSGDSSWTSLGTLTPTKSGNSFTFSNLKLGSSFDYKEEYQFQIIISDKLQTIGNQTKDIVILSTGKAIVRIGKEEVIVNGNLTVNEIHRNSNDYLASFSETKYSADANDFTKSGMYYLGTNAKNAPVSDWVKLYVNGTGTSSSDITQIAVTFGHGMYYRNRNGSTWGSWYKIPTLDENQSLSIPGAMYVSSGAGYHCKGTCILRFNGTNTVLAATSGGDIYFRPNGESSDNGRMLLTNNGKLYLDSGALSVYGSTSLYSNTSGSNGTITLNESSANFNYIEIFFRENSDVYSSVKVPFPDGKTVSLTSVENTNEWNYYMNIKSANVSISGTSITRGAYKETNINADGGVTCTGSNRIYIYRVVGYR